MANVIKHKRGSGSDPVASDLVVGEVAIRTDVGKLFTKMDNGSVAEIAGGGSDIVINTLSSSSATGGGSATFNGSAYRFTLSSPPSVSAQQLLVSINGVIQKPVAGTGQPSEGFSVDGTDIILGDAPETGADFFIITFKSLGVSEPADNSVTSAKIVDGAIVNADINASAAIAGTKISPSFTSDISITNAIPRITFYDSGEDPDWEIGNINGAFRFRDITNSATWMQINTDGHVDINGGLDVTGAITGTGDLTLSSGGANRLQMTSPGGGAFVIKNPTAASLSFGTNNQDSELHIANGGNVGIGTSSPNQSLEVAGNIGINANLIHNGDTDTMLSFSAANQVDIQCASTLIGRFTTNGLATGNGKRVDYMSSNGERSGVIANADSSANALVISADPDNSRSGTFMNFAIDGSERMRIDSSGNLVIKGSATSDNNRMEIRVNDTQNEFRGSTNSGTSKAFAFYANNTNNSEIATFDSDGLKFGTDTAAANALNDYEQGTFTPIMSDNVSSGSATSYDHQSGHYTKIGNIVHIIGSLRATDKSNLNSSGTLCVRNLPFVVSNVTSGGGEPDMFAITFINNLTNVSRGFIYGRFENGSSGAQVGYPTTTGQFASNLTIGQLNSGGNTFFSFSGTYRTGS